MIRIVALTPAGQELGERICNGMPGAELWFKPTPFGERIRKAFGVGDALIMICATGIVVRTLAPVISSKQEDPPVIVLDEATANLDPETEAQVERALGTVLEGRTAIVIAHRLRSAEQADRVVMMDQGRVIADGSHVDLVRSSPEYGRLVRVWERGILR